MSERAARVRSQGMVPDCALARFLVEKLVLWSLESIIVFGRPWFGFHVKFPLTFHFFFTLGSLYLCIMPVLIYQSMPVQLHQPIWPWSSILATLGAVDRKRVSSTRHLLYSLLYFEIERQNCCLFFSYHCQNKFTKFGVLI